MCPQASRGEGCESRSWALSVGLCPTVPCPLSEHHDSSEKWPEPLSALTQGDYQINRVQPKHKV